MFTFCAEMTSTFQILLPVFGLIFAGFLCRRRNVLGPNAASELNRFVVWLALPALLFHTVAKTSWSQLYQPGFVAVFGLGLTGVFGMTVLCRLAQGVRLADASIDGMAAAYPNAGYIGFPMCLLVFGPPSLVPTTISTLLVACVLFAVSIAVIEASLQSERRAHRLAFTVLRALAKNPLIVAPVAGLLVVASEVTIPTGVDTFLDLLAKAASPCALVSLGLFLAERPPAGKTPHAAGWITGIKLLVHPLLTWVLAAYVFDLSPLMTGVAVLLAALPTGTGPYMLAEYYVRDAQLTARVILWSTVGSLVTLSVLLSILM